LKTIFLTLLLSCLLMSFLSAQQKVYIAYIEGDIDLGLAPYISRVIANAEEDEAAAIIFKINTFGGRVDAATQIKDAIMGTDRFTIAFINNRAISAGALIAISCGKIVMVKGSSIGAATVVDQTGGKVGEKYQSYMRSEMRSTAERNGARGNDSYGDRGDRGTALDQSGGQQSNKKGDEGYFRCTYKFLGNTFSYISQRMDH